MMAPEELLERLRWRYATKLFDAHRKIPSDLWQSLAESLVLTPSSFGLQPWEFIHVQTPALREELRGVSWNQPQVTDASHFLVLAARTTVTEAEIDRFLAEMAAATGASAESLAGYRQMIVGFLAAMSPEALVAWAKHQSYIALGQLMGSAAVLGVDSCPMEGFDAGAYNRILGLTDRGFTAAVACALGYRSEDDGNALRPKVRYGRGELVVTR
jgi:nitroreductase